MSLGHNDTKHYTAQDFERYYSGKMTAEEMHALEKAALDDPFLADALEGYKATPSPVADTAWLKQQLEGKTQGARVVPIAPKKHYPLLRIAALVILLLGAGWSVYYLMDSKKDTLALETPSQNTTTAEKATAPVVAPDTTAKQVQPPALENQAFQPPVAAAPTRTRAGKPMIKTEAAPPVATAAPPAANVTVSEAPKTLLQPGDLSRDVATAQRKSEAPSQGLEGRVAGITVQKAAAPRASNAFQGRVVDQNNQGVPNATVAIRNTRKATATDQEGYFSLKAADSTVTASVSAPGYESQSITLNNQQEEANIVLQQSNQSLEEVVVTGYSKQRAKSVKASPTTPYPVEGWAHFQTYMDEHRKPSKELSPQGLSGSVTLSFDVSRKGVPTNIKVDTSLSPHYDEEAVRLLKEGPKWERKKGTRGKVTIHFPQ